MKTIFILIIGLLPLVSNAQDSQLNEFFDKYSGKEGYTSVYITKYMFNMFKHIESDKDEREFNKAVSQLTAIKILTVDDEARFSASIKFRDELMSVLPKKLYKELMIIKDGKETVTFLIREEGSKITELVMTVDDSEDPLLLFLEGDINLNEISKLSRTINIRGFEHLERVNDRQ